MRFQERVTAMLLDNDVPFSMEHVHETNLIGLMQQFRGRRGPSVRTVLAFVDGHLSMLVLPADRQLDLVRLSRAVDGAVVDLTAPLMLGNVFPELDMEAMPPLGNLWGMPVYLDAEVTAEQSVWFYLGSSADLLELQVDDLCRLVQPVIAPIATLPTARLPSMHLLIGEHSLIAAGPGDAFHRRSTRWVDEAAYCTDQMGDGPESSPYVADVGHLRR